MHEGAPHEQLRQGAEYNLSERQNIDGVPALTHERVKDGLQRYIQRQAAGQQPTNKKLKKKAGDSMRKALASCINEFPPMLLDHALRCTGFDINLQPEEVVQEDAQMSKLLEALAAAGRTMEEIMSADVVKGYIFGKLNAASTRTSDEAQPSTNITPASIMYSDFHPFKPKHLEEEKDTRVLEFETFNQTVDEFYSSIEGQKLESRLVEKEENARKKLENARQDQAKRLGGLQDVQTLNIRKAQAIEANTDRVTEATNAVNGLVAQGMDWLEVEQLVKLEQKRGNPVAEYIKLPLKLHENTATLLLGEMDVEEEDDDRDVSSASEPSDSDDEDVQPKTKDPKSKAEDKRLGVDIDLALTPWANAREYYDQKKTAAAKEEKTLLASARALKSTERKIDADLKKALKQEKDVLRPVRQAYWFEKFLYFISSDGYLVLGSRDAQQSEILYKRYMKQGDVFVHAELDGAIPVIIKNHPGTADSPIPPSTLSQAGNLSISTSTAWDSKAIMSAWWVPAGQVTKTASTGDYLAPGKFAIKGDKKYLPPAQLLLGFAVLFRISEDSKARHTKHRVQPEDGGAKSELQEASADLVHAEHDEDRDNDEEDHESASEAENDAEPASPAEHSDDEGSISQPYVNPLQSQGLSRDSDDDIDGLADHIGNDRAATQAPAEPKPDEPTFNGATQSKDPINGPYNESEPNDNLSDAESDDTDDEANQTASSNPNGPSDTNNNPSNIPSTTISKPKTPIPVRGKRGKKKRLATKYANQDAEDRAAAMALLGSAIGQQKAREEAAEKVKRDEEAAAQRQRRREQHDRAQAQRAKREAEGGGHDDEDDGATAMAEVEVDLDALVGTPLPGDEILEALPICAPWSALGRYKYKAKLQPGSTKKGKAMREVLGRWAVDGVDKKKVDEKAEDTEKIWPREIALIKAWKEAEVFGVVPVGKVRVMMAGASGGGGGGGGKGGGKKGNKGRSGKGPKKVR